MSGQVLSEKARKRGFAGSPLDHAIFEEEERKQKNKELKN